MDKNLLRFVVGAIVFNCVMSVILLAMSGFGTVLILSGQPHQHCALKPGDIREHAGKNYIVDRVYFDAKKGRWTADESLLIEL